MRRRYGPAANSRILHRRRSEGAGHHEALRAIGAPLSFIHLRRAGFDVEIYDSTFGSFAGLLSSLDTGQPATLGVYGNLMTRGRVLDITREAKARGWKVVVGGPEPSNYAAEYLAAGADVIVEGEGERTLEELLPALSRGDPLAGIAGILYREGAAVIRTGTREQIADLDAQPWPDRERVDINAYLKAWRERHGKGSVSLLTARGCPYHCRWCSHSTYGKTHRRRSPEGTAAELEWILGRYNPELLWIADDVFTIHHGWLNRFAAEVKRKGIQTPFECITRADRLNARAADRLAELGCYRVWIGSESGSQRILDAMERGVKVEQVREAVGLCRARGIETGMFLMWGYEGEDESDIEATIEHVKLTRPDSFLTTVSYPIKGTPYYDAVASKLVQVNAWTSATDRDFLIRGRHSRRYYQFADQLLKSEVLLQSHQSQADAAELRARIQTARAGMAEFSSEVEA